jgi:ABA responsive element binding factor
MGSHPLSPQQGQARLAAGAETPPSNPGNGTTGVDSLPLTLPSGGSRFGSLARQASIYSLTLDEFQNAITEPGKNFGSMNMDEFLKNIWTAEESQAMAAAMGSIGEGSSSGGPTHGNSLGMLSRQPSLQRQGSITLPRTLSRKTVDEVWKDIHRNITGTSDSGPPAGSGPQERQQTFGEMTLEDFLMKAGVVREDMEIGSQGFGPFVGGSSERDRLGQGPSDRAGGESVPTLSLSPANAVPNQATIDAMQIDSFNKNQAASQQRQVRAFES